VKRFILPLLLCLGFAPGVASANEQEELEKLRKRIGAMQQELEKNSESKSEAADALRDSERAISDSNRKLYALSKQQREATGEVARLQEKSSRLRQDMQGLQARLAALLYQQYLEGQQEYLQLLLGNNDPDQAARDLQYYGYIARAQAAWLNTLRTDLTQLDALSDQSRRKSDELNALQQAAAKQKAALEKDRQARQKILIRISARIRQQNREIGRLQQNENRLAQLVEKLTQMSAQANNSPFESLRGKLALPVKGRVSNKFGTRRPDSTALWKGWFVRAPAGQEVKAVAPGQVVFADWLRGFGNLLIIDHGKGYMSLYGNNETLYKQVGDTLHAGEVIATSGNSGGNEDSGLYFELRHEGKPMDPAKWVAKR
jgi:septal ring factor EnvC (AmiA/AmiB activator)